MRSFFYFYPNLFKEIALFFKEALEKNQNNAQIKLATLVDLIIQFAL